MAKTTNKDLLIYGGYAVGALILYKVINGLLVRSGLTKSTEQAKTEADAAATRRKELDVAKKKSSLTRPESAFYSAADTIYNALKYSSLDDDADAAQFAFTNVINNAADLAFLKYVYGSRSTYNFGIKQGDFDLLTTLQREFSSSRYNDTVNILRAKGVYL
jgi:hypothetical protein